MLNEGGSATMDKQPPRLTQGHCKGNGAAVDRRNDYTPNRNGRQKRYKDSSVRLQESAPSRPGQKWNKTNGDKRPRQRGYFEDRQREEVADDEDISYEEEPIYASNSRKGNGNHLLSFQYERRGAQQISYSRYKGPSRPRYNHKTMRYKKEQFLQASYQFVVRDSGQYVEQAINPDALVTWDMVELVRNQTTEEVKCSICLMPPMAGKVTRCGHTFCWACILHYLSTDESDKLGCPLCHQPVLCEDLRSIQHILVPLVKEGEQIEMKLMRKNKGNVYVCPKSAWEDKEGKPLNIHDGVATHYNKVLVASSEQIYSDVIETEKAALTVQMLDAEDYETGFIAMAQDLLKKREKDLKERIRTVSSSSISTEEGMPEKNEDWDLVSTPLPPGVSFDGSQISTTYTDAFEDEMDSGKPLSPCDKLRNLSVGEEAFPFETLHEDATGRADEEEAEECPSEELELEELDSQASEECVSLTVAIQDNSLPVPKSTLTASEAADHLELPLESPPGRGHSGHANQTKDVFYFYQASTGQHIYLNSLNVQCLVKEYGSLENSPETIKGTVVAIDRIFIDEEMRKRFRYLNHIPLTCEIQIVELKLHSPILSKDTLKTFQAQFDKRRKQRQRKSKEEKARAKKYEAEHRRKNPELYHEYTIVTSHQFPRPHSTSELSSSVEDRFGQSPDQQSDQSGSSPAQIQESTSPSSVSFAQIIKCGKTASTTNGLQSAWPTISSSASAPSLNHQASPRVGEEDEEGRPPSYAASMFQAWDNVSFRTPAKEKSEPESPVISATPASGGGGKKKKKKEKQVLFSTAMARKN